MRSSFALLFAVALGACGAGATTSDAASVDSGVHTEPAPGAPGGTCGGGVVCADHTECGTTRCVACGGLGERPCASGCREGAPRYGVCMSESAPAGTLGGICYLHECAPGSCTHPDGLDIVCFACGQAQGQPCCPISGCEGGLACTDDVCH